jgi:hypothetical protein
MIIASIALRLPEPASGKTTKVKGDFRITSFD